MFTDPKRVRADIPGTVEGNPVFTYHDAFNPDKEQVDDFKARYRAGKVGDVEVKRALHEALNKFLDPIRERRADWERRPDEVQAMLMEHTARARETSRAVLGRLRERIGLRSL
jgi:tryptophanyl-tRNA synthetase